jgi:cation diffusion facilitator family transporter
MIPQDDPLPGHHTGDSPRKLGKYEVLDAIGRGAMGTVYLGFDPFAARSVAIKVGTVTSSADAARLSGEERSRATRRVTLVGAGTNAGLAVAQVIIGWLGNSQALVADAMHTFSDLLSDSIAYFAARHAHEAPDAEHPYGHGRYETAATLAIGVLLSLVGIGIVWSASIRLFNPASLVTPEILTLWAAGITTASKEVLYRYAIHMAKRVRSEMLRATAWHHRSDAWSSIIVFVGIGGTQLGLPYLDAIAAVAVGFMILKMAWQFGAGAVTELVDTGLSPDRLAAVRATILSVGGVRDIHMLRTRLHGGQATADVHVLVDPWLSVSEGHMISLQVEQRLKREIEEMADVTVHVDPEDDSRAPTCSALPLRPDALERLHTAWAEFDCLPKARRVVLHYLSGHIDVDLYLPLDCFRTAEEAAALRDALQAALTHRPEFGRVVVLFGQ